MVLQAPTLEDVYLHLHDAVPADAVPTDVIPTDAVPANGGAA
jgi:hypothetical protein